MALFHVSHLPWLRLVGVRTSYIHFSNISWTPRVLDPITNPFLGPSSWLHPASNTLSLPKVSKLSTSYFIFMAKLPYSQLVYMVKFLPKHLVAKMFTGKLIGSGEILFLHLVVATRIFTLDLCICSFFVF